MAQSPRRRPASSKPRAASRTISVRVRLTPAELKKIDRARTAEPHPVERSRWIAKAAVAAVDERARQEPRPRCQFGRDRGLFTVPDDFNASLPPELLELFEK